MDSPVGECITVQNWNSLQCAKFIIQMLMCGHKKTAGGYQLSSFKKMFQVSELEI